MTELGIRKESIARCKYIMTLAPAFGPRTDQQPLESKWGGKGHGIKAPGRLGLESS